MTGFLFLLALAGCENSPELAQPNPPPEPLAVVKAISAQVKLTGTATVVSVKNGDVEVPATLQVLDGELALRDREAWSGAAGRVDLDLSSFHSGEDLRDIRVKEVLLRVAQFPKATFELTGGSGLPADGIAVGSSGNGALAGQVSLAGMRQAVQVPVHVTRHGAESWTVETAEPVSLSLRGFGLSGPVEALRVVCEHESIADQIAVSFSVVAGSPPPPAEPEGAAVGGE